MAHADVGIEASTWPRRVAVALFLVLSLPFLVFGISALLFGLSQSDFPVGIPGGPDAVESLTGQTWDQVRSDNPTALTLLRGISRVAGLGLLGFAIFVVAITSTAFRQGRRWAWFTLLVVPGFMFGLLLHERTGDFVHMPAIFLSLSLVALVLPIRSFFASRS